MKEKSPFSEFLKYREARKQCGRKEAEKVRALVSRLDKLFLKYGIEKAYLFGSVTRGSCRPDSDIDLYVEDIAIHEYWNLWRDLETFTDHDVDLYCQNDDPALIERIKQKGELIYESRN